METLRDTHSPNELIGNFKLVRLVRTEEATELWRAEQPSGPYVSLRRLTKAEEQDQAWREALREASARAKKVEHFNVAWCLGALEFDGRIIQISECVHELSIDELLQAAETFAVPIGPRAFVWVAREILAALLHAADRGHEHGRLAQENVFITREGEVKVDFGVVGARLGDDLPRLSVLLDRWLAQTGSTLASKLLDIVRRAMLGELSTAAALKSALDRCFYVELDGDDLRDGRNALAAIAARLLPDPNAGAPAAPEGPGAFTQMMMARERPVEPMALTINDRATGGHVLEDSTWSPGQVIRGELHALPRPDPGPATEAVLVPPTPASPPPEAQPFASASATDVELRGVSPFMKLAFLIALFSLCLALAALTLSRRHAQEQQHAAPAPVAPPRAHAVEVQTSTAGAPPPVHEPPPRERRPGGYARPQEM